MKSGDAFGGAHLKAEDIKGHNVTVTIEDVTMEKVGDGDKPVMSFKGKDKTLVLNKTNWARLAEFLGSDDSDDWNGRQVVLGVQKVDYAGKRVDAIRVLKAAKAVQPPKPEPEDELEAFDAADESTPF